MQTTITIPLSIQDECLVFIGKIRHNNFYLPIETIVFKDTIGVTLIQAVEEGEYKMFSDGKFLPNKTFIHKPLHSNKKDINAHATDDDGNFIEFSVGDHEDLNGYVDIRIEVYP